MDELEELRKKKYEQLKERFVCGGRKMEQNWPHIPLQISDVDFDATVKKYSPIVIDCWAPWCGPCRMIGPIIEELAKEMQGKIVFGKLNVDENPMISGKYQIMSIPTLLVFKDGSLVDRVVGALPKDQLKSRLTQKL